MKYTFVDVVTSSRIKALSTFSDGMDLYFDLVLLQLTSEY